MPKQKSNVQTALKKLIVLNGFANKEYVYIYINVWFVTRKNEVLTISHMQKSCTPAVPRSVFYFFGFGCLLGAAEVLMVAKYGKIGSSK
jgi:hypothetical protein